MCFLGVIGIVLMIIENELRFHFGNDHRSSSFSWLIKLIITISTIVLLLLIFYYHYLDLILFSSKNNFVNSFQGLTIKKLFCIFIELIVCTIHPFPHLSSPSLSSLSISSIDIDIALGLPSMLIFIRKKMFLQQMLP